MRIDIIISADYIKEDKIKGNSVVVIDMLRATSTIVTAMGNGCKEVIPVLTPEEAFDLSKTNRSQYILGGERNAIMIDGFDCSNSPLEYDKDVVGDKTIIMTTSNGTRAIKGCENAENILIGSMLNAHSVAEKLYSLGNDVVIVNAGTAGEFSIDDFICSGYIIECMLGMDESIELSDIAKVARHTFNDDKSNHSILKMAKHYNIVKNLGYINDLEYCSKRDIYNIVPEYKEGKIS